MCNFIIINILESILLFFYYLKYESNTFIVFINDEYIKNRNNKNLINDDKIIKSGEMNENIKNRDNKNLINDNKIINSSKKDEKYYINRINVLENKVKTLENKIKEMEINIKGKDKIINEILNNNDELENKVKTLENKIKEMEIKIKEKDKIINENINNNIKSINNNIDSKKISELEEEIKQLTTYILSPGEKLIYIKIISMDQKINFSIAAKNNDIFTIIENILYKYYPEYKKYDNYFLVGGRKIYKNLTIEENKIKNKDVLTLTQFDENS